MQAADFDAIERATIDAVAPEALDEADGWLIPFDSGTVGRAHSAAPLWNAQQDSACVQRIEALYRAHALAPAFRVPDLPRFAALRHALQAAGYAASKPTFVQTGGVTGLRAVSALPPADIATAPDAGWAALYTSEGFDAVDGASRVRTLSRATGSLYASVREGGRTVAAGALALGHGWASVHGMRTAPTHRGQGLAGRVLAAMADAATARGIERVFLQVEAGNAAAQSLYRRAGFATAWSYAYWHRG